MKILCFQNCFFNIRGETRSFPLKKADEQSQSGSRSQQYLAAICACSIMVATGSYQAWSSPAIPHLISNNSKFVVTEEQIIWIVSLFFVGDLFGALINPIFIDKIGRKKTLLLLSLPSLIGWGLIIFAQNYIYLYIARFLGGISQASAFSSLSIYLTEISEKSIRGIQVNIMQISYYLGVFIFTTIGAFLSYDFLNISSATFLILFLLISLSLPETPYYLLLRGKKDDAIKCLMKLRGITSPDKLEGEVREMELVIEEDKKSTKTFAFLELFRKSYNRKGLIVVFLMRVTMMVSGVTCILSYAEDILSQNTLPIKAGVQVMILNGISLPAAFSTGLFIDKINRRYLFLITGVLGSVCLTIVGFFFFLKLYLEKDTSSIAWLPLVSLSLLFVSFISGFGIIPHITIGELFSIKVKSSAACLGRIVSSVASFGTAAGFKPLGNNFGTYTSFWIFASLTFIGSLLTFWILPNTIKMTLEEIQAMQNPKLKRKLELECRSMENENS